MALTTDQIYDKLLRLYPKWFSGESASFNLAHARGVAAMLHKIEVELDAHVNDTFITLAGEDSLEALGEERSIIRATGEDLEAYRARVRSFENSVDWISLKDLVDGLLVVGEATLLQDTIDGGMFCDRGHFLNRGEIIIVSIKNAFSILIDYQGAQPDSFYENIRDLVNTNRAFGADWRLVERFST